MTPFTLIIGNKNYSSWSLRPWLVLKQAGIDFAEIRIPLDTPDTHHQIRHYSPTGKVPVLQHGSLTIWESLAICEYLAEHFPDRHLYPQSTIARAIARVVSAEMHAGFQSLRQLLPMDCRSRYPYSEPTTALQTDIDRIQDIWRTCRQQFGSDGPFLFGDFTIADAMFAPVVSRFTTYHIPLDPIAQTYVDTIWAIPAMQDWLTAAQQETEVLSFT